MRSTVAGPGGRVIVYGRAPVPTHPRVFSWLPRACSMFPTCPNFSFLSRESQGQELPSTSPASVSVPGRPGPCRLLSQHTPLARSRFCFHSFSMRMTNGKQERRARKRSKGESRLPTLGPCLRPVPSSSPGLCSQRVPPASGCPAPPLCEPTRRRPLAPGGRCHPKCHRVQHFWTPWAPLQLSRHSGKNTELWPIRVDSVLVFASDSLFGHGQVKALL